MKHPTSQVTTTAEVIIASQPGLYIRHEDSLTKLRFAGPVGVQLMRSLALELTLTAENLEEVLS